MKRTSPLISLITALVYLVLVTVARAALVSPSGYFTSFSSAPPVGDWSTLTNTGGSGIITNTTQFDLAVQTNVAGAINLPLGNATTVAPSINSAGIARHNGTLQLVQTVPTGVAYISLLATLQNDSGANQSLVTISYDLGELNAPGTTVVEELPGHRVYWSLTGLPSSWMVIPEFSGVGTPGTLTAAVNVGTWLMGSPLYLLWVDDNANADRNDANTEEGGYTIDNFSISLGGTNFVAIINPTNGQMFVQGVPITINASASSSTPLTNVAFYQNGTLIDNDALAPYSVVYSNASPGVHTLTAVAQDLLGNSMTSAPVQITVVPNTPPTVTLTTSPGGTVLVGLNITNLAVASDSDPGGAVARVEFYVDNALRFTDTTSPYTFEYCDVTAGTHTISAVAMDNVGARSTNSNTLTAVVPSGASVVVSNGSAWTYLDNGTDPGPTWTTLAFNDTGWSNGVAELGYGDNAQNRPEVTVVSFGPNANAKYPTTYFRRTFTVPDAGGLSSLTLRLLRDDGGIVYLNGTEVFRSGITNAVVDNSTYTPPAVADDGTVYQETNLSASVLVPGLNIVAVEIHQDATNSSDISFDLMLWGYGPQLTITRTDATHADVSWPFPSPAFILESKMALDDPTWTPVLEPDVPDGMFHHVNVVTSAGNRFFRLRRP